MTVTTLDRSPAPAPAPASVPARAPSVLAAAGDILERGWLQHGWYLCDPVPLRRRLVCGPPRPEEVRSACLVAAIAVAAHRGSFLVDVERDALPWIGRVWQVLHPGSPRRLAPRERIRDLVAWNDHPRRSQHEVVAAVRAADDSTPATA